VSPKTRGPRSPVEQAHASISTAHGAAERASALNESLAIVQHARELEARRGRTHALPDGAFALQRLLIALLETLTPEQRAEVRRRLGE
jgi:hypothetical protein